MKISSNGLYRLCSLILVVVNFSSCGTYEQILIEEDASHKTDLVISKMVSIDPELIMVKGKKKEDKIYLSSDKQEKQFVKQLSVAADYLGMELLVFDKETLKPGQVEFYNELQPLRYQILNSAFIMETDSEIDPGTQGLFKSFSNLGKYTFDTPPQLSPEYSYLADMYGTPYFTVQGIYSEKRPAQVFQAIAAGMLLPPLGAYMLLKPRSVTYYYQIIADVRTGSIVHREIRQAMSAPSAEHLRLLAYDSFNVFIQP